MITTLLILAISSAADGAATDKDFKIVADGSSTKVKAGKDGTYAIKVVPLNGFHVSDEAPFSVNVTPSAGLVFSNAKLGRSGKEPAASTSFAAKEKGAQKVTADVVFFLCTEKLCQRMTAQHELAVTVN